MEARYKSLAAMDAAPWVEHFKKTAGQTSILSHRPRAVVIKKQRSDGGSGSSSSSSSSSSNSGKVNASLPLTIVSPVGQSNEMARADLNMESDKRAGGSSSDSVARSSTSWPQRGKKRKQHLQTNMPSNDRKKKTTKLKDIFSRNGSR